MIRLLTIEWAPIRGNKTVWILFGLYLFLFSIFGYVMGQIELNLGAGGPVDLNMFPLLEFPDVWHNLAYLGSYFNMILVFIVIMLVSNEYSYRTLRQHLIDGMTRIEFLLGKYLVILVFSLTLTLFLGILSIILGYANASPVNTTGPFEGIEFLGAFFLQTFAYLSFAFFVALLLRKAILAIGLFILYSYIIENIPGWITGSQLFEYLPGNAMDNLIQNQVYKYIGQPYQEHVAWGDVGATVAWIIVFALLSYVVLSRKDL